MSCSRLKKRKDGKTIIHPNIIRSCKEDFKFGQSISIWGLSNPKHELDRIWGGLENKIADVDKTKILIKKSCDNINSPIKVPNTDNGWECQELCNKPHYNVLYSGGWDSTALIIEHLEKGEPVIPFVLNFVNHQDILARISIAILQKHYGNNLLANAKELFGPVLLNGNETMCFGQQSLTTFFASKIHERFNENAIATEIAYCMNDDAISYLTELKNLYNSGAKCTYPQTKVPPLRFPLIKKKHFYNSQYVTDIMRNRGFMLPLTCLDSCEYYTEEFIDKNDNTWISIISNIDKDEIHKDNKLVSEFYNGIFICLCNGKIRRSVELDDIKCSL